MGRRSGLRAGGFAEGLDGFDSGQEEVPGVAGVVLPVGGETMVGGSGGGAGEVAIVRVVIGLGVRAFITGEILDAAILGDAIDGEAAVVFIVGAGPEERGSGPMGETGRSGLAKAGPIVQTITERADGATPAFDEGSEDFIGIAEDLEGGVVWQDQVEAHPPIRQAGDGFDLGAHQRTRVVFGVGMDDLRLEGGGEAGGLGFHNRARGLGEGTEDTAPSPVEERRAGG